MSNDVNYSMKSTPSQSFNHSNSSKPSYEIGSRKKIIVTVAAGSQPNVKVYWRGGAHKLYLQKSLRLEVAPIWIL